MLTNQSHRLTSHVAMCFPNTVTCQERGVAGKDEHTNVVTRSRREWRELHDQIELGRSLACVGLMQQVFPDGTAGRTCGTAWEEVWNKGTNKFGRPRGGTQ